MEIGLVGRQIHSSVSESAKKKGFLQANRNEFLRHLTKKGVDFLLDNTELEVDEIKYSKRLSKRLKNDYFHRVSTIFTHISFDKRVEESGGTNPKFLVYYDSNKKSSNGKFEAETRLSLGGERHFTPDVICSYVDDQGSPHVYCLEVYNGNKFGYVTKQLEKLFWILDNTTLIEKRIGVEAVPRILVTFDNESLMKKTKVHIQSTAIFQVEGIEKLIFFSLDSEVWEKFSNNLLIN